MNTTYILAMNFNTDAGKVWGLRLTGADPAAADTDVRDAMSAVIDADVIAGKNGSPIGIRSARLIKTEATIINVA